MKIVACTHWTNWRNGIIVAGIASRLAVARQSCQSHPLLVLPSQRPHQDNDLNQRRKRFPERSLRKKNHVLGHLPQVHDIQFIQCHMYICYKTILTLMPGWRSCQQMLETRFQCTSHSPCPETIVIRSTWDYFKFSGDVVFIFDPKRCIKKGSPEDNRSAKLPYPDSGKKKEGLETTMRQH